jgi:phosphinothricin acetyltransferase
MPSRLTHPVLRDATPSDAAGIAVIWNAIIRDTPISFSPTERDQNDIRALIHERQSGNQAFMVADDTGKIAGFSTYSQFRGGLGYARSMEHTIHIAPEYRGAGIGRMLLVGIEDHARRHDYRLMIGAITASNTASIQFHKAMGYHEYGHIPAAGWKFGQFHDLVLMGKDLAP